MSTRRREVLLSLLKVFDMGLVVGCFVLTSIYDVHTTSTLTAAEFFSMRIKLINFMLFAILLVVWHMIFLALRVYDSRRLSGYRQDAVEVFQAATSAAVALSLLSLPLQIRMLSPRFLLVFWITLSAALISSRIALRWGLTQIRLSGRNLRNMLIVGTNARAVEFARMIDAKPELGYRIVGFADQTWQGAATFSGTGYSMVSDLNHLPAFLRSNAVDEMIIALPLGSMHKASAAIVRLCEEQGIITRLLSSIFDLRVAHMKAEDLEGASVITNYTGPEEGWPVVAKRVIDIVLASTCLVLLSPLLLAVALLLKLSSPGPVLFKQHRLGLNKHIFTMYKFRTMVDGAEEKMKELEALNEASGPVFKIRNDPRVTTLGKVLRKTSIDELPQLVNVLKGDMSLVGPRPLPVRDYNGFKQDWQRRRFSVQPGITCLWQINGRSAVPFEKWMQMDLQYIDKWSLWLDLAILMKTIPAVFRGCGAV